MPQHLSFYGCPTEGAGRFKLHANTFLPFSAATYNVSCELPGPGVYCVDFVVPAPPSLAAHADSLESDGLALEIDHENLKEVGYQGVQMRTTRFFPVGTATGP